MLNLSCQAFERLPAFLFFLLLFFNCWQDQTCELYFSWEHLDLLNPVIACTGFSKFSKSSKIHYGISTTKPFCPKKSKNISFDFKFFFTQPGPDCHNAISRKNWLYTLHRDCPEAKITFIFLLNSVNPVHRNYWIQ